MSIEKLDFKKACKESIPFVMISTFAVQNVKNAMAGFIWVYLHSLPSDWTVNKRQLMAHFDLSERSYQRHMRYLSAHNLIRYERERNLDGTLGPVSICVLNGSQFNPDADSDHTAKFGIVEINHTAKTPLCGEPTSVVFGTLTNTIENKKEIIKEQTKREIAREGKLNFDDFISNADNNQDEEENKMLDPTYEYPDTLYNRDKGLATANSSLPNLISSEHGGFERFWSIYPRKSGKERARLQWVHDGCELIADYIINKLKQQIARDKSFLDGYSPNPHKYIVEKRYEDEIFEGKKDKTVYDHRDRSWAIRPSSDDDVFNYFQ